MTDVLALLPPGAPLILRDGDRVVLAEQALRQVAVPESDSSPLVLLEMIHRLKVRDVMYSKLFTLPRKAPLKEAQELMRANHISGIPINEGKRLYGIVSIDDDWGKRLAREANQRANGGRRLRQALGEPGGENA